jgi:hypothetical protein
MNWQLTNLKLIGIAIVAIVLIVSLASLYVWKRRATTAGLRQRFGSEYIRTMNEHGSSRKGEAKLLDREKRMKKFTLRDLAHAERQRFLEQWKLEQVRFLDSPGGAVLEADDLVSSLMQTLGYPVSDFEQRAADISVDHPRVTEIIARRMQSRCGPQTAKRPLRASERRLFTSARYSTN